MTANIPGGDDRNRQNLRSGDSRLHITALSQPFHQGVHHDKSGDDAASDRRLLLAALVGLTAATMSRITFGFLMPDPSLDFIEVYLDF